MPLDDRWRIVLCKHGPYHTNRTCGYARSLQDLMPPNESKRAHDEVWCDRVDRFFGQNMSAEQIERFLWYCRNTEEWNKPLWCHALEWYLMGDNVK